MISDAAENVPDCSRKLLDIRFLVNYNIQVQKQNTSFGR